MNKLDFKNFSWNEKDVTTFENYLKSLSRDEKINWTKNILRTHLPVYATETKILNNIAKDILKGDYKKFLDCEIFSSHESMIIYGKILSKLKNFEDIEKYLNNYAKNCDCWATCDTLSFDIKNKEDKFFNLAQNYFNSKQPFVRRIGIIIFFKYINTPYLDEIFKLFKTLKNETEYYVNMAVAWFICDAFIKQRVVTIDFIKSNAMNKFTLGKAVSKCNDSFRVSSEDKKSLKLLKLKLYKSK